MGIKREMDLREYIHANERIVKIEDMSRQVKTGFTFEDEKLKAIREKIEKNNIKLGDIEEVHISMGVTTGCNELFIITEQQRKELGINESKYLHKIVAAKEVGRYAKNWKGAWLIEITKGTIKDKNSVDEELLKLVEHLKNMGKVLNRTYIEQNWSEHRFNKPVCMIVDICDRLRTTYSNDEVYALDTLCYISGDSDRTIKYMTAVLNSKITDDIFKKLYATPFRESWYRHKVTAMGNMMIPEPSKFEGRLCEYTEEIQERKLTNRDTYQLEQEIEKIVQQLYGLTDDEVEYLCK